MGGDENKRRAPDEGIMVLDDDIDPSEGSDSYGKIIYEKQEGSIVGWTSNREDRQKLRDDLVYIIENSGENVLMTYMGPTNFLNYYAIEIRLRRCEA